MAVVTPDARRAALLVIDIQNDFVQGAMAVPEAKTIIRTINKLKEGVKWTTVILSKDSHPVDHISFADNHPKETIAKSTIMVRGRPQQLWPVHCVQGTKGEEFHSALKVNGTENIVKKGVDKNVDCYSAFFDNNNEKSTGLTEILKLARVSDVYVCGLAYDYCVGSTAIDSVKEGFKTFVIEDAVKEIAEHSSIVMRNKLQSAGVESVHSSVLLTKVPGDKRQKAAEYFAEKKIMPLLQKLTAMLIHDKPDDPKAYLIKELKRMKESKLKTEDLTSTILDEEDFAVVYRTADVSKIGSINRSQCRQALLSLGIPEGEIKLSDKKFTLEEFKTLATEGMKML